MQRLLSSFLLSICVLLSLGACKPDGGKTAASPDPLQLMGRIWIAEDIAGATVIPPRPENPLTLVFAANGRLTGNTGCNRLMAGVSLGKGTISMTGPVGTTRMACSDPALGEQESRLTANLQNAATWSVKGGKLIIADAAGKPILRLREDEARKPPADAPAPAQ
jgi:heat shock protein HslJ